MKIGFSGKDKNKRDRRSTAWHKNTINGTDKASKVALKTLKSPVVGSQGIVVVMVMIVTLAVMMESW